MEVYRQFLNNEPLDSFISGRWEIELALQNIKSELFRFSESLERLFILFYSLFPKKSKLRKNLHDTEQLFKKDLIKQFKKFKKKKKFYSKKISNQKKFLIKKIYFI